MPGLGFPLGGSLGSDAPTYVTPTVAGGSTVAPPRRSPKIDPDTGDLVLENGQLVFVSGIEAIRQNVQTRLSLFLGEWFLDETAGVPYYQSLLVKGLNENAARGIFRTEILKVPGVVEVVKLDLVFNRAARTLRLTFSVRSDTDQIIGSFVSPLVE